MKISLTGFLVILFAIILLAAQQTHAKKGCTAFGHACYGGHGKRSLNSNEQEEPQPNSIVPVYPGEDNTFKIEGELSTFPKYHLIKLIKSWFKSKTGQRTLGRFSGELDYPLSSENYNHNSLN